MNSASVVVPLLCLAGVVTASLVPVAELFPPKPYEIGYSVTDERGEKYRQESEDIRGNYGFLGDQGVQRLIKYVTDKRAFRAKVKTNEPASASVDGLNPSAAESEPSLVTAYKSMTDVYKQALDLAKRDFFKEAILAKKMKEQEPEAESSKTKPSLLDLYKLGLLLPNVFEMYGTERGLGTKSPVDGELGYMKYLAPEELLLLSLFAKDPEKDHFLSKPSELTKLESKFETKKHFPSFKEALLKGLGSIKS